jgi:hypothetical protein
MMPPELYVESGLLRATEIPLVENILESGRAATFFL